MIPNKRKTGLALSGGGYRAAAFHLGTLKKLYEYGLLSKVSVMSTISGGAITGAAWYLYEGDYDAFHKEMSTTLKTNSVIRSILISFTFFKAVLLVLLFLVPAIYLLFTPWAPSFIFLIGCLILLLLKFQFQILPVSKEVEKAYDKFFYGGRTLNNFNPMPLLAIGSSNLQTGRPFTFSKLKMTDSTYAYSHPSIDFLPEKFPIARAVTASSCVPFAFTPVTITEDFFANKPDVKRIHPLLVDGGVYDNQGIQKLSQRGSMYECDIIITSDAGGDLYQMQFIKIP